MGLWMIIGNIEHPYSSEISDSNDVNFIKEVDSINKKNQQREILRPVSTLLDSGKYSLSDKRSKYNICELYNDQGIQIKWDKLVYGNEIVDKSEGSLHKYGKFPDDMYSSKLNLYRSKTRIEDDSKRLEIIEGIQMAESILSYYFNICPEGGTHERANINDKCKKCALYLDIDGSDKRDYIIKYKNKYENSKSNIQKGMNNNISKKKIMFGAPDISTINLKREDIDKWMDIKLTDELLNQMSYRYKEPANVWKSISQCERVKYDDIVTGVVELEQPETLNSHIIYLLNSYINEYFTYKIKKGFSKSKEIYNIYNELYNYKRSFTSKKIDEIKDKAINLHSWMKAFLFTDALIFHEEDNEMAFTILNQIITSDTLLCKNDLMIAVTTTVFEADLIGVDELEPLLDDMDDLDIKIKED
jgi:hypothetical protein